MKILDSRNNSCLSLENNLEFMISNSSASFVHKYCFAYAHLFREVRTFENFRYLHMGMISVIKRKSLPAIAHAVGLHDAQPLHNFLTDSPWSLGELRNQRLAITLNMLKGRSIKLIINESGDKKKGNDTDYVTRQYISNLGKTANGIVSINAYGVLGDMSLPLMFKVYKPKDTLKEGDVYKSKSQLASLIIKELLELGFKFDLVIADSFYGENETLVTVLNKYSLPYVVVAKSNHERHGLQGKNATFGEWRRFYLTSRDGTVEYRYMQEIRFGETALKEGLQRQLPATGNPSSALAPPQATANPKGETALKEGLQRQLPATGNPSSALAPPQATALAASEAKPEALGDLALRYPKGETALQEGLQRQLRYLKGEQKPVTYWKITTEINSAQTGAKPLFEPYSKSANAKLPLEKGFNAPLLEVLGDECVRYPQEDTHEFSKKSSPHCSIHNSIPRSSSKARTWYLITNLMGDVEQKLYSPSGICKWIGYSFKQVENELGWADFRVTDYKQIERWWEIVMSAYLLLTLLGKGLSPFPMSRSSLSYNTFHMNGLG